MPLFGDSKRLYQALAQQAEAICLAQDSGKTDVLWNVLKEYFTACRDTLDGARPTRLQVWRRIDRIRHEWQRQRLEETKQQPVTERQKSAAVSEVPKPGEEQPAPPARPVEEQPSTSTSTGQTWTSPIGMQFVLIPQGTFQMGSNDADAYDDEKPVHQVIIRKPFYLGIYEVTQRQWQAVMGTNPSHFKGDANLPVDNISWEDVQEFLKRLNAQERRAKYRLPTEAEWEYAARAGATTAYGFSGDASQLGDYAWFSGNAGVKTHPVGQKKPNAWGLYDMHGNVWEWVQDWYGSYAAGAAVDPAGPTSGPGRMDRGGGWSSTARLCRSARRGYGAPGNRLDFLGFRLLREIP